MSDTNSATNVPRKVWIAKTLTHWSPGLGHLYCGEPLAALAFIFVGSSLMLAILTSMMFASASLASWALLLLLVGGYGGWMYAARDVKRAVGLVESDYQIQSYNRW